MQDPHGFEPPSLAVDYSGGGIRYVLPRRQLAGIRHCGWILIGFGGFVILFMAGWMWMPITAGIKELQQQQPGGWLGIGFGCLGIFGLIPGLGLLMSGIAIVFNRTSCVVDLRDGVLRTKERLLLASWRRKRKADGVERLRVSLASEWKAAKDAPDGPDVSAWLGVSEAALVAETSDGKEHWVAVAYPRELLLQLAADLAARLQVETQTVAAATSRDPFHAAEERPAAKNISVIEGPPAEAEVLVPPQPAESLATIERRPHGITIDIPPVGIRKGSRGLIVFAFIWNGIIGLALVMLVLSLTGAIEVDGDKPDIFMLLFMIPFVAVGVGVALVAVNMGRRHATIATADNLVMIVRHSIFGKTTKEWSAEQIDEIRVGNSGMEVNDVPIQELQIHARDSRKFGCLSQLDAGELAWIAGELNQALILAPEAPDAKAAERLERDDRGRAMAPAGSRLTVDYDSGGAHIHVPAKGLRKNLAGMFFGFIFASVGVGIAALAVHQTLDNGIGGGEWFMLAFLSLFVLVFGGIGLLVFAVSLISVARRFQITADSRQLTVVRRGFIFRRTFSWGRDSLEPITVTSTGTKVNDRAYYQVSIASRNDASLAIMSGYDRGDLEFVACAINESLGLTKAATTPV